MCYNAITHNAISQSHLIISLSTDGVMFLTTVQNYSMRLCQQRQIKCCLEENTTCRLTRHWSARGSSRSELIKLPRSETEPRTLWLVKKLLTAHPLLRLLTIITASGFTLHVPYSILQNTRVCLQQKSEWILNISVCYHFIYLFIFYHWFFFFFWSFYLPWKEVIERYLWFFIIQILKR